MMNTKTKVTAGGRTQTTGKPILDALIDASESLDGSDSTDRESREETGHTPGPWMVDDETVNHGPIIKGVGRFGPMEVAAVYGDGKEQRAKNASLIAASSELLDAARLANQELLDLGVANSASPALNALWWAIAKAEGRQ